VSRSALTSMPKFTVRGAFYARRGYWQTFTKEHEADSADAAREWTLSEIGGCHSLKRSGIRIDSVEASPAA
jgi:ribosomal protein L20A (L18A)